jgi:Mg2+ and Co2+ transporter CorA
MWAPGDAWRFATALILGALVMFAGAVAAWSTAVVP